MKPIGVVKSIFKFKAATPRQSGLCEAARGSITINRDILNNPGQALEDLDKFSHIWVIFILHQNGQEQFKKAKVRPPRLQGKKVGMFSTRSPHRLNPIGLTLAKLDRVAGDTVYLSGIDMIDGTPVLDIKPYIPMYDSPVISPLLTNTTASADHRHSNMSIADPKLAENLQHHSNTSIVDHQASVDHQLHSNIPIEEQQHLENPLCTKETFSELKNSQNLADFNQCSTDSDATKGVGSEAPKHQGDQDRYATGMVELEKMLAKLNEKRKFARKDTHSVHVGNTSDKSEDIKMPEWLKKPKLNVTFSKSALEQIKTFKLNSRDKRTNLKFLKNTEEVIKSIEEVLQEDPRSTYFKRQRTSNSGIFRFAIDNLNIHCSFDTNNGVEVQIVESILDCEEVMDKLDKMELV